MVTFLIYVIIFLFIIAVIQLIKVTELSAELKGGKKLQVANDRDNRTNGFLWFLSIFLMGFFCVWQMYAYGDKILPRPASEHGEGLDNLLNFNFIIIAFVFVLTHFILFYFAYKYNGAKSKNAVYYPDNNKLELIWTTVPAVVMAVIIIYGLKTWNEIMDPPAQNTRVIELFSKQFSWTARYAGKDNTLGKSNYRLIAGANDLGIDSTDAKSHDDLVVRNEFHLPVGEEVQFMFRSQDVIHGAYFPHFRAQMNTVPGMTTTFHFRPTITTEKMRTITNNPNFDYILLCNKICGASHYNMQMTIVVESKEDFETWLSKQTPFLGKSTAQTEKQEQELLAKQN